MPASLIGGVTGGAITPANTNVVDVVATQLVFTAQPPALTGINVPVAQPEVRATDTNGLLDFDVTSASITSGATLTNTPSAFVNGILTFTGFQYAAPGDGTLTVSVTNPLGVTPSVSNHVDVVHVNGTLATGGVTTGNELFSSSTSNVIFGITFDVPYSLLTGPQLNEFTIDFGNPFTAALSNFRVYASLDASLNRVTDPEITSLISHRGGRRLPSDSAQHR